MFGYDVRARGERSSMVELSVVVRVVVGSSPIAHPIVKRKKPRVFRREAGILLCADSRERRARGQGSRETQGSMIQGQKLLATTEHPDIVGMPDVVRIAVAAVEPETVLAVLDAEHLRAAVRTGDRFHADQDPLAHRLILVGQTEGRSDFGREDLETHLDRLGVDFTPSDVLGEAEIAGGDLHEIDGRLF